MNNIVLKMSELAFMAEMPNSDILSFRPFGEKVKEMIKKYLDSLDYEGVVVLDFDGIKMCDLSFVDEVIFEVIDYIKENDLEKTLIIEKTNDDVFDTIRGCQLRRQDKLLQLQGKKYSVPFLLLSDGKVSIVGDIETKLHETFSFIYEKIFVTARDVSDSFNIAINNASNRLKRLNDSKLILRKEVIDETGKYFKYYVPRI